MKGIPDPNPRERGQLNRPDFCPEQEMIDVSTHVKLTLEKAHATMNTENLKHGPDAKIPPELRSFLMYAFMAETDLRPSETTIVMRTDKQGQAFFAFQKKDPNDPTLGTVITNQQKKIETLAKMVDELRQENRYLKSRNY